MTSRARRVGLVIVGLLGLGVVAGTTPAQARRTRRAPPPAVQPQAPLPRGAAASADERFDDRVRVPRVPRVLTSRDASARVVVYLEQGGASLTAGADAAARARSSVLIGRGLDEARVPGWSRSDADWQRTVACVQRGFAAWQVDVVDERPASGEFIMAVVGGESRALGYGRDVAGVAPYSGAVIHGAVAFVFEQTIHGGADAVCEVAVHEIGHTLGLDHEYLCEDPMSYLHGCGAKRFQDAEVACGEWAPRECADGAAMQNSVRHLGAVLGVAAEDDAPAAPDDAPAPDDTSAPDVSDDTPAPDARAPDALVDPDGPSLTLLTPDPAPELVDGEYLVIAVQASDASGVARIELGWGHTGQVFTCDDLPEGVPIWCVQEDDVYVFALRVGRGRGARTFAVRATDAHGNVTTTDELTVRFD